MLLIFLLFLLVNWLGTNTLLPSTEVKDIWFYSGLVMLVLSILVIEPFYSSPKNVITNTVPLLLVFIAIKEDFADARLWFWLFSMLSLLLVMAIVSLALNNENKSENALENIIAKYLRHFASFFGHGKILYSIVFLFFIVLYYNEIIISTSREYFFSIIVLWGLILALDPKSLHSRFSSKILVKNGDEIGEIISIQSNDMYLVKLYADKLNVKVFDLVRFSYAYGSNAELINEGFVFDTYNLNSERWAKVIQLRKVKNQRRPEKNIVYQIDSKEGEDVSNKLRIKDFVGVVVRNSTIGRIKFEYSKLKGNLNDGDLLELDINSKKIFYQVIAGTTEDESLENRNKSGFIIGEAMQLGCWNNENLSFEKFGWLPQINTPVFVANTESYEIEAFQHPEYQLGIIPHTNFPSIINLNEAASHHLALLGVTGSGKSFLAREIIKEQLKIDFKIIVIDFTGEWKEKLHSLNPASIIKQDQLSKLEEMIAAKEDLKSGYKSKAEILKLKRQIQEKLSGYVKDFLESNQNLALFEIPELSNTTFILEFTQLFIESIFQYAKTNSGNKISLVLEEAHTIVPETNFLGDLGDYGSSKALVSKMSQIALQGRKYGVGLMVIAQRTANVSKTVLTQCNTIICFQAFDETSFTFLGNYIGKDLVQALPHLKKYHAIVTGKAIKSNIPMIVDLKRKPDEGE